VTAPSATDPATVVESMFGAFAQGDLPGFAGHLHADATWNHRNDDRFGGVHRGPEAICAFLGESVELTAGTLRAVPTAVMADGAGHVAVHVHLTATRPDGRVLDDMQVLMITVDGGRARSIEQYIGDPSAIARFWA
jgi:ketosteroid isomerase-like protein